MHEKWIKIGFWVFACTAVFFGVVSINQKINLTGQEGGEASAEASTEAFDQARQRSLDTDEDGLNDWEELNVHKTSPYLSDSDSDGASDYEEVAAGRDPNCPEGRVCGSGIIGIMEGIQQDAASAGEAEDGANGESAQVPELSEESTQALQALEAGEMPTGDQLRALLRDAGIPEEQLEGVSDEALIQLFQEVAAEQEQTQ